VNRPTIVRRRRPPSEGQTLVEFALVFPIFFLLLIALIEFGLMFNALLAVNFATRDASLIAAEAGNASGADCVILKKVNDTIGAPASPTRITEVRIFKADKNGNQIGSSANVYLPGSMTCTMVDGTTLTVPYSLSGSAGYRDTTRCNILIGCSGSGGVDTVGVRVAYHYSWVTPLSSFLNLAGSGADLIKANSMRMEPIL
jgi:hypothetical protein